MATNVPSVTFGPRGFIVPPQADILAGVQADIDQAFGGGLNPALETPQGQLASSMAAITANSDNTFQKLTQEFDPAYNDGRYQDAIARIYFLERLPARATIVQGVCTGLDGTVIPVGAIARASDNNLYTCIQAGEIVSGTVTLSFACNTLGPIACPADSLNAIYQAIFGWDTINNPSDGVIGTNTESRQEFETRRAASVALNSNGSLPSIRGAVLSVAGVLDAYATENATNAPLTIGGVTLAANSLYVAVVGGDVNTIAKAIWSRKAPGCSYNGNTTVVVLDQSPGYSPPYPSYNVTFEIPPALPILGVVSIANNVLIPADAVQQVQAVFIAAFTGADGGARATIGSIIYAARFYAGVAALGAWAQVISIKLGSPNVPNVTITASIAATTLTVTAVSANTLASGQTLLDTSGNLAPGTVLGTQIGGTTGGVGTYNITPSQTVSSEVMTATAPTQDSVTVRINQVPTIAAANIAVVLV